MESCQRFVGSATVRCEARPVWCVLQHQVPQTLVLIGGSAEDLLCPMPPKRSNDLQDDIQVGIRIHLGELIFPKDGIRDGVVRRSGALNEGCGVEE